MCSSDLVRTRSRTSVDDTSTRRVSTIAGGATSGPTAAAIPAEEGAELLAALAWCRRRRVGLVFQDALLFPHLKVRHNLAFGRWFAPAEVEL